MKGSNPFYTNARVLIPSLMAATAREHEKLQTEYYLTKYRVRIQRRMIRPATEADLTTIDRIEKACFPPGIGYPLDKLRSKFEKAPSRFFLTEIDGKPAGYFWSERWEVDPDKDIRDTLKTTPHTGGNVLYIANVAVMPEFRGRALGKEMMNRMLQELPQVEYALLAVSVCNMPAYMIYRKLGFKTTCVLKNYYIPEGKPAEAAFVMKLKGGL